MPWYWRHDRMGEMAQSVGPAVAAVFVQNVDTQIPDIEITIEKPGTSWLCFGRVLWRAVPADPVRSIMIMLAVNGVINELTRVHRRDDWGAGSFRTQELAFVLENLAPGDTVELWGNQSVDDLLEVEANASVLQVIAFGPEFRPQGFLTDTG